MNYVCVLSASSEVVFSSRVQPPNMTGRAWSEVWKRSVVRLPNVSWQVPNLLPMGHCVAPAERSDRNTQKLVSSVSTSSLNVESERDPLYRGQRSSKTMERRVNKDGDEIVRAAKCDLAAHRLTTAFTDTPQSMLAPVSLTSTSANDFLRLENA